MKSEVRINLFSLLFACGFVMAYGKIERQHCTCSNVHLCQVIKVPKRQEVVGYGVDLASYKLFDWSKLTTLVVYEPHLRKIGMELVCMAHKYSTRVLISAPISVDQLGNKTARLLVVDHHLRVAQEYHLDGANIDVEFKTAEIALRNGLTLFAEEMKAGFNSAYPGSIVIADVFWLPNIFHNTAGLAKACDFLFIMSYDEQNDMLPPCIARANAPYAKTFLGVAAFLMIGIPADKLVVGLPWYGYQYNCQGLLENDVCYIKKQGHHCTEQIGSEIDYKVIMKLLQISSGGRKWSSKYKSPYINVKNSTTTEMYQIWYDDPESLKLKCNIMHAFDLRGVGIFHVDALNYTIPYLPETLEMWNVIPKVKS